MSDLHNCQFCGTELDLAKPGADYHSNAGQYFCHVGPTGHSCWSQFIQYVDRGFPTPYEQEQEHEKAQR